jgi:hypothetical protein
MKFTLRMRLLVSCGMLFASCGFGQTWQTSWEQFAKEIAPYPAQSANPFDPDVKAKFDGKQVTWEGTVEKNAKYSETTMFLMEVTPQEFRTLGGVAIGGGGSGKETSIQKVTSIQVMPKKGSLDIWKTVAPGRKLKFNGVLKEPIYMVLRFSDGVRLIFKVEDAEPLLPVAGQ